MDQKDVKKRDVMGFDQFSEAWDTVRKVVMMKKGENANPAASEIQGEPLFSRNDANPYKAMGIPHDEATANINRNVLPGQTVMVQDTKHDGKDQGSGANTIDPQPVKDMDKERDKENKNASKEIPKQIHEGLMDFDQFDAIHEDKKDEESEEVSTQIATHVLNTAVLIDEKNKKSDYWMVQISDFLKSNGKNLETKEDLSAGDIENFVSSFEEKYKTGASVDDMFNYVANKLEWKPEDVA